MYSSVCIYANNFSITIRSLVYRVSLMLSADAKMSVVTSVSYLSVYCNLTQINDTLLIYSFSTSAF